MSVYKEELEKYQDGERNILLHQRSITPETGDETSFPKASARENTFYLKMLQRFVFFMLGMVVFYVCSQLFFVFKISCSGIISSIIISSGNSLKDSPSKTRNL